MSIRLAVVLAALSGIAFAGSPATAQQGAPETPPAAAPPAAPPVVAAPPPEHGTPAIVLSPEESEGIIGKSVRSASGEDMGRIVDVIISANNQPRAAVIDFGGFLGVGSRKIAVDWRLLQYSRTGKTWGFTFALNRNQVRVSPEYKPGEPVVVLSGSPSPPAPAAAPAAAPVVPAAPAVPVAPAAPAPPPSASAEPVPAPAPEAAERPAQPH
ncbi:PRC-barrel domain-containing protein [Enterovirga sp.]|uniref:PRC-barrel domain-containing protein n=1 Tax=Enterovirga sp. TaxID=2026350 RepID=UPI002CD2B12E|nr:PRC-barrel domain-containing protein [Enterovirga sp.]HMO29360.1 PRC-barrel domain-containing protein [Enterovirga sp.]